ncbi:MAG TPA: cystathionine gamma-synthase [Bacteroidales bacterium]|nr:cystathionine gamma-synthase [Bacteroidales bacterium]HNR42373.1 cystathionine gamma-synthase [Bacteroidales bacterium]HPM18801.1 cystathionine gamma-synthase [Bacteroidales bacterium]HPV15884.1 cystathionine gamma-synthase [Bacteroidales bacterium]
MKFETKAIWVGQEADPSTGATILPIYQTSTFSREEADKPGGYEYSRVGNPTRAVLDKCLASLEEGRHALSFSSGMAAEHAVFSLLRPGDHAIVPEDMYGGTYRLIKEILEPAGITFTFADYADYGSLLNSFKPSTRMVWLESPTNPLLKIFDIGKIADTARDHGALTVVDNTFASPYFQKPLLHGADIVVHSTTKYINGHSDVIGGAVILNDQAVYERIRLVQKSVGAVPSPFDSWLTLRGLKTLAIRLKQHELNAFAVARHLKNIPKVTEVFYPGLEEHPGHAIAKKQMTGFGGVVSFRMEGGLNEANAFFRKLKIFQLADSLGGVESLANYPAIMTHGAFPAGLRKKIGVTDNLIRLSVGIEHIDDLLVDLENAFK